MIRVAPTRFSWHLLLFYVFFICGLSGGFYEGLDQKTVSISRAVIISITLVVVVGYFLSEGPVRLKLSRSFWFVVLLSSYGFLVAALSGGLVAALSTYFRLLLFAFVFETVRLNCISPPDVLKSLAWLFILLLAVAVTWSGYEYIFGQTQFLNGALRSDANLSSPIGFSAYLFTLMLGLLYFWLAGRGAMFFAVSLIALMFVFLTGTRSVSVAAVAYFSMAIFLKPGGYKKTATYIGVFVGSLILMKHFGALDAMFDRMGSVNVATGTLDASGSFRLFILETFWENITVPEFIFGLGLGGFHQWFEAKAHVANVAPHFELLWLISELGLLGALLCLGGLALIFCVGLRRFAQCRDRALLFLVLSVTSAHIGALHLANPFYFYQFVLVYGVLWGLLLASMSENAFVSDQFR